MYDWKSILEDATAIHEYIAGVCEFDPIGALNVDFPETSLRIPICSGDFVIQFDILHQAMLLNDVLEILPYLGRLGIILRPVRVSLPGELIRSRRYVTGTAGISVDRQETSQ